MRTIRKWAAVALICLLQYSVARTAQSAEQTGEKVSLIYCKLQNILYLLTTFVLILAVDSAIYFIATAYRSVSNLLLGDIE